MNNREGYNMSEQIYESWDDPEKEVIICTAKKDKAKRILEYLEYSEINAYSKDTDKEDSVEIIVAEGDAQKALQYISSFLIQEKSRAYKASESGEDDGTDNIYSADDLESKEEVFEVNTKAHSYQTNSEKYNNSTSSAFSFMIVGTGLLVVIALVYLNVIDLPIRFSDNPMLSIILPLVAVIFEIIAIVSWKQAQKYRAEIGTEEQFDKDIKEWFLDKYTSDSIDALCSEKIQVENSSTVNLTNKATNNVFNSDNAADSDIDDNTDEDADITKSVNDDDSMVPTEILFLQRIEAIEKILNDNYPNLDKGYVGVLSEELYQELFDIEN